jgi:hypothetical protein
MVIHIVESVLCFVAVVQFLKALHHNPEGRGFDSRCGLSDF